MKHKTSELEGANLDAAVARVEGTLVAEVDKHPVQPGEHIVRWYARSSWGSPSTDWSEGGQIIERERIELSPVLAGRWTGSACGTDFNESGPTPLIAAMRAYVASKLGEEVDLP